MVNCLSFADKLGQAVLDDFCKAGGSLADFGDWTLGGFPQGVQGRESDCFQSFCGLLTFRELRAAQLVDQYSNSCGVRLPFFLFPAFAGAWLRQVAECAKKDGKLMRGKETGGRKSWGTSLCQSVSVAF